MKFHILIVFITLFALVMGVESGLSVNVGYDEYDYWEGTRTIRVCRKYDSEGRLRQKIFYWGDGSTLQQDQKFDANGNKVEEVHYNASGALQANVDGWAAMRARYNDDKPVLESFYGDDGHIMERKIYSRSGKLIARQMMGDKDFDPYEQFEARPISNERVLYYDRSGQLKGAAGGTQKK
ncbi:MAG: hypothetical protein JXB40_05140 [Candidatus Omnitrophica bacterium]|nr:hypothetical protein [Candidatus Omnitrophota bacterium]